jgi:C1A family cysteine protease
LGVALDEISLPEAAFAIPIADDAATITCANLVSQMPAIRNQQQRGTCVAHAALASFEHLLSKSGSFQDLSEQFLYWNCKRNDGIPTQPGTWLGVAMPLLQRDGCCDEPMWPYVGHDILATKGRARRRPVLCAQR